MLDFLNHRLLVLSLVHQSGSPLLKNGPNHRLEVMCSDTLIRPTLRILVLFKLVIQFFDQEVVALELY